MKTQKKSYFKGLVYFIAELVWFFIVAVPLAVTLYLLLESVSLIKSIIIKCQKTITR